MISQKSSHLHPTDVPFWLVVDLPLWKILESVGMMTFPTEWEVINFMFQTTNQHLYRSTIILPLWLPMLGKLWRSPNSYVDFQSVLFSTDDSHHMTTVYTSSNWYPISTIIYHLPSYDHSLSMSIHHQVTFQSIRSSRWQPGHGDGAMGSFLGWRARACAREACGTWADAGPSNQGKSPNEMAVFMGKSCGKSLQVEVFTGKSSEKTNTTNGGFHNRKIMGKKKTTNGGFHNRIIMGKQNYSWKFS